MASNPPQIRNDTKESLSRKVHMVQIGYLDASLSDVNFHATNHSKGCHVAS